MKRSWATWFVVGGVCLTLPACRPDYDKKLLERDLRLQEDKIYDLQDEVEQLRKQLAVVRQQNSSLLRGSAEESIPYSVAPAVPLRTTPGGSGGSRSGSVPPPFSIPGSTPRSSPGGGTPSHDASPPAVEVPGLDVPRVEMGTPSARRLPKAIIRPPSPDVPEDQLDVFADERGGPTLEPVRRSVFQYEESESDLDDDGYDRRPVRRTAAENDPGRNEGPSVRRAALEERGEERVASVRRRSGRFDELADPFSGARPSDPSQGPGRPAGILGGLFGGGNAPEARIEDYRVAKVQLDRRLTGGWNADGRPGDEGVALVLELRNAANQVLPVPATVSIVAVDTSLPRESARVARWDVAPDQAADSFKKSFLGKGMHLELPWPGEPPVNRNLHLFVKVLTESGQEFRVDQPILVDPILPPGPGRQVAPPGAPGAFPLQIPTPNW